MHIFPSLSETACGQVKHEACQATLLPNPKLRCDAAQHLFVHFSPKVDERMGCRVWACGETCSGRRTRGTGEESVRWLEMMWLSLTAAFIWWVWKKQCRGGSAAYVRTVACRFDLVEEPCEWMDYNSVAAWRERDSCRRYQGDLGRYNQPRPNPQLPHGIQFLHMVD